MVLADSNYEDRPTRNTITRSNNPYIWNTTLA